MILLKRWKSINTLSPSSYLQWTRGTGWPGVLQIKLHLLRLQSLRVHAFQRRASMLRFAVVWSNHWCTARGTQMTHDDAQHKNTTMRKETVNVTGAESSSDGDMSLKSKNTGPSRILFGLTLSI